MASAQHSCRLEHAGAVVPRLHKACYKNAGTGTFNNNESGASCGDGYGAGTKNHHTWIAGWFAEHAGMVVRRQKSSATTGTEYENTGAYQCSGCHDVDALNDFEDYDIIDDLTSSGKRTGRDIGPVERDQSVSRRAIEYRNNNDTINN